uniref:Uncharacterized protein n=1 Tax=Echinococcus granulosus TaxID=6210 RepID=A0A068X1F1_ECHGR|nr:hypothetical protein EgrG_002045000 [Echinococcus granulosus]
MHTPPVLVLNLVQPGQRLIPPKQPSFAKHANYLQSVESVKLETLSAVHFITSTRLVSARYVLSGSVLSRPVSCNHVAKGHHECIEYKNKEDLQSKSCDHADDTQALSNESLECFECKRVRVAALLSLTPSVTASRRDSLPITLFTHVNKKISVPATFWTLGQFTTLCATCIDDEVSEEVDEVDAIITTTNALHSCLSATQYSTRTSKSPCISSAISCLPSLPSHFAQSIIVKANAVGTPTVYYCNEANILHYRLCFANGLIRHSAACNEPLCPEKAREARTTACPRACLVSAEFGATTCPVDWTNISPHVGNREMHETDSLHCPMLSCSATPSAHLKPQHLSLAHLEAFTTVQCEVCCTPTSELPQIGETSNCIESTAFPSSPNHLPTTLAMGVICSVSSEDVSQVSCCKSTTLTNTTTTTTTTPPSPFLPPSPSVSLPSTPSTTIYPLLWDNHVSCAVPSIPSPLPSTSPTHLSLQLPQTNHALLSTLAGVNTVLKVEHLGDTLTVKNVHPSDTPVLGPLICGSFNSTGRNSSYVPCQVNRVRSPLTV